MPLSATILRLQDRSLALCVCVTDVRYESSRDGISHVRRQLKGIASVTIEWDPLLNTTSPTATFSGKVDTLNDAADFVLIHFQLPASGSSVWPFGDIRDFVGEFCVELEKSSHGHPSLTPCPQEPTSNQGLLLGTLSRADRKARPELAASSLQPGQL